MNRTGRHALTYINRATGRRIPMLNGSRIAGARVNRPVSSPVVVNRRAGHAVTLVACVRRGALPPRIADIRLRVVHRAPDGTLLRAIVTRAGRVA